MTTCYINYEQKDDYGDGTIDNPWPTLENLMQNIYCDNENFPQLDITYVNETLQQSDSVFRARELKSQRFVDRLKNKAFNLWQYIT